MMSLSIAAFLSVLAIGQPAARTARDAPDGGVRETPIAEILRLPVLLALLHRHALSGAACRPLDLPRFLALHVKRFVAAYGAPRAGSR